MNRVEREMAELLADNREAGGIASIKAEFEAEGARLEEMLRLTEIARAADLGLTLKIGGCEAIMDMRLAKQLGVGYIVAPMVETPYALRKYIDAKNVIFSADEQKDTEFLFNLETITTFHNLDEMLDVATAPGGVSGVVFGRVDFAGSLGTARAGIESGEVTDFVRQAAIKCRDAGLDFVLGGGISADSLSTIIEATALGLTRFETRKIVFSAPTEQSLPLTERLKVALQFELLWLENKRDHYRGISEEDLTRIDLLSARRAQLASRDSRDSAVRV